jgi:hypothetical protein
MAVPVAALPAGIDAGQDSAPKAKAQRHRGQRSRGESHAAGQPRQGQRGRNAGKQHEKSRDGNRSQGRNGGSRHERPAGLDPATGLPAFLTRPQSRPAERERQVEA